MTNSNKTLKYHKLMINKEIIGADNYEMIRDDLWSDDTSKIRIIVDGKTIEIDCNNYFTVKPIVDTNNLITSRYNEFMSNTTESEEID